MQTNGFDVEQLEPPKVAQALAWARGEVAQAPIDADLHYLLAHCDDGIVWGRLDDGWQLSSGLFQNSPTLSRLRQLRLFGPSEELFIWRFEETHRGRLFKKEPYDGPEALRPKQEYYVMLGERVRESQNGFSLLSAGSGRLQIAPLPLEPQTGYPLRLEVEHFFSEDEETGAVRCCLSRFVTVKEVKDV